MIRKCFTINQNRSLEEIKSFEEKLIKTHIFQGVEIFYPYDCSKNHYDDYVKGIKNFLKYPDLEIVCHLPHGVNNNLATKDENVIKRMKKAIDFANMFGVKKLTLHPGSIVQNKTREEATMIVIENIKNLTNYANQYHMTIMLENLVGENELCLTKEEMQYFLNQLPGVKFIFDCGHCHASRTKQQTSIVDFVESLKNDLLHLHLSDNDKTKDMHAKIGIGTIDFATYFKVLKKINYKGLYCSEVLFNTAEDLIETAKIIDEIDAKIGEEEENGKKTNNCTNV